MARPRRTLAKPKAEHTKAPSSLFPSEMIAKLERTKCYCKTKQASYNKPHKQWEQQQTMNKQKQTTALEQTIDEVIEVLKYILLTKSST